MTHQGGMAGSTFSITYLAKGLADRGHEIYAGIRPNMSIYDLLEHPGITRIPMGIKSKLDLKNMREIRDVVRQYKIDIINAQSSYDRYTSVLSKKLFKLPVKIVHTRRQMPLSSSGFIQKIIYNKWTDSVVAVSHQVKRELIRIGIKESNITVIHNGTPKAKYEQVDHQYTEKLREKFGIQENDFVIGSISRPKKQIQILQALKLLEQPVTMIFCGIEASTEMQKIIAEYQLPHKVFFEGKVEEEKVLSYYGLFDCKVLASTMEGLSQSLLEAMAMGTPVIATASAGNLDLIDNEKNGLLFENGDIEGLAKIIDKVRTDRSLREQLINAGKTTALEKFEITNTISKYERYFNDMLIER